ncbi:MULTISPECIES: hypothetical protein [Sphingomonas]|uniref:Uncharacterized protein n=1 Tax=Edaphosphingomonas fennica TaxID=114404 RepID=A0A2T4HPR5_9SPHN|nr:MULTISPECIES: hypothetical protein [Sphingomonas]AGH50135.1 hypothetical protein G432_12070 [Sphingomonas sp. MM-1]PTD17768.1 hypothetical protein CV103_16415 [Sphingomonas fennica]
MAGVEDELKARIAQIDRDMRLLSVGELRRRADAIAEVARANGMEPLGRLAADLGDTLQRSGRGAGVRSCLDGMRAAMAGR